MNVNPSANLTWVGTIVLAVGVLNAISIGSICPARHRSGSWEVAPLSA